MYKYVHVLCTDMIALSLQSRRYHNTTLFSLAAKLPSIVLQSKASSTNKKYQRTFNALTKWANTYGMNPLPAEEAQFAVYLVSIIQKVNSPASVDEAVYGVKWAHELAGYHSDVTTSFFKKAVRERRIAF